MLLGCWKQMRDSTFSSLRYWEVDGSQQLAWGKDEVSLSSFEIMVAYLLAGWVGTLSRQLEAGD